MTLALGIVLGLLLGIWLTRRKPFDWRGDQDFHTLLGEHSPFLLTNDYKGPIDKGHRLAALLDAATKER